MSTNAWDQERARNDERDRANQPETNRKGVEAVRAELRRLGKPEHGPNWKEPDTP